MIPQVLFSDQLRRISAENPGTRLFFIHIYKRHPLFGAVFGREEVWADIKAGKSAGSLKKSVERLLTGMTLRCRSGILLILVPMYVNIYIRSFRPLFWEMQIPAGVGKPSRICRILDAEEMEVKYDFQNFA